MIPLAQAIIVVCIVVLSAALVITLLAMRRLALRADGVLAVVEREIRPLLGQLESLTAELRELSQGAGDELKRIKVLVGRAEDASLKVARLVLALSSLTRFGQYASMALGVKRGLSVFVRSLKAPR
jgi:uncharacterized protein YoxC